MINAPGDNLVGLITVLIVDVFCVLIVIKVYNTLRINIASELMAIFLIFTTRIIWIQRDLLKVRDISLFILVLKHIFPDRFYDVLTQEREHNLDSSSS